MNIDDLEGVVTLEKYLELVKRYNALELRQNIYSCVIIVLSIVLFFLLASLFISWFLKRF